MRVFFAFWPVFSPVAFYLFGVYIGFRLSRNSEREQSAYVRGWHDALSKRRVVLAVAEKFLKEDA